MASIFARISDLSSWRPSVHDRTPVHRDAVETQKHAHISPSADTSETTASCPVCIRSPLPRAKEATARTASPTRKPSTFALGGLVTISGAPRTTTRGDRTTSQESLAFAPDWKTNEGIRLEAPRRSVLGTPVRPHITIPARAPRWLMRNLRSTPCWLHRISSDLPAV